MDATELYPLTADAISRLLLGCEQPLGDQETNNRRQKLRWPFPGTIQAWIPDEDGVDQHFLATCMNLSLDGVGMMSELELPVGMEFTLAIHQPEASLQGRGVVRHCTEADSRYYIGVQFIFDEAE